METSQLHTFYQEKFQNLYEIQEKNEKLHKQKQFLEEQKQSLGEQKYSLDVQKQSLIVQKQSLEEQKQFLGKENKSLEKEQQTLENRMNQLNLAGQEAKKGIESGNQKVELGQKNYQIATQNLEKSNKVINSKLTQQFYSIFYAPTAKVPEDKVETIFSKYLSDNCITIEVPNESIKTTHAKLGSMKGVIQFLNDNADRKGCNFKSFGSEVYDVVTLAQYLVNNPRITAVAFNNGISEESKNVLKNAVELRKGSLKVMFS